MELRTPYGVVSLPEPECESGYTERQVREIVGDDWLEEFYYRTRYETKTLCEGRRYNHDTREYEPSCGPHGVVVHEVDVVAFLLGRPPLD